MGPLGGPGQSPQLQADLGWAPVLLVRVATPTRGNDVLPHVLPTGGTWPHGVDVLGGGPEVLALVRVPDEHGPPRQRRPSPVGNLDEVGQPDDGGYRKAELLGVVGLAV